MAHCHNNNAIFVVWRAGMMVVGTYLIFYVYITLDLLWRFGHYFPNNPWSCIDKVPPCSKRMQYNLTNSELYHSRLIIETKDQKFHRTYISSKVYELWILGPKQILVTNREFQENYANQLKAKALWLSTPKLNRLESWR